MRETAGVGIVAGLLILRIGLRRNAVALKFESRPAPLFGVRLLHLIAPDGGIFDMLRRTAWCDRSARGRGSVRPADSDRRFQNAPARSQRAISMPLAAVTVTPPMAPAPALAHQHFGIELVHVERVFADDDRLHFD